MSQTTVTVVGSREAPKDVLILMILLGRLFSTLGCKQRSGDAYGSDRAFYYGALLDPNFKPNMFEAWLPRSPTRHRYADDITFLDFQNLMEGTQERCIDLVIRARGSIIGLNNNTLALHSRNVVQVLGPSLDDPSDLVVLYAKPVKTKDGSSKVRGGTNTAYQIALDNNIEIWNLATPEGLAKVTGLLIENPFTVDSSTIDWSKIIDHELLREGLGWC